jgi:hypothetical protein
MDDRVGVALAAASAALGRELRDLGGLGGSDRSHVHRVTDGVATLVVKGYSTHNLTSWARERVGLGVAGGLGLAPRLFAATADPALVVMEDLGTAPDVASHLLGTDPGAADAALLAWATTLGRLHARSHADRHAIRAAFASAEAEAAGEEPIDRFHAGVGGSVDQATTDWAALAAELGVSGPPDVGALADSLAADDHHALSPADACPDNNLLLDDGCRLIDFEWAEVRHPAWDAAYLTVPWPTCWCSWRIPDATAERTLDAYREEAAVGIPYVGTEAFLADVEAARSCWALVSVAWSLTTALREDEMPHPASPGTRPRMQHRLQVVARSGTDAADFAGEVLEHTRSRWGDLALPLAPAYR